MSRLWQCSQISALFEKKYLLNFQFWFYYSNCKKVVGERREHELTPTFLWHCRWFVGGGMNLFFDLWRDSCVCNWQRLCRDSEVSKCCREFFFSQFLPSAKWTFPLPINHDFQAEMLSTGWLFNLAPACFWADVNDFNFHANGCVELIKHSKENCDKTS